MLREDDRPGQVAEPGAQRMSGCGRTAASGDWT
ncbi:Protein of unknown function [Thermobacillus xylanilyticus]|uniref:Uncharacterized protein n=1 Tax=Thermobacillus xylanilyticus TaxID=76633 RepID=A0ABM8V7P8_THEXY|nr:Protein of unknown function [Thermobacillus xylanilyticus]